MFPDGSSPSPMSLSPTTSIHGHTHHGMTHTIREEPDIEQEEPLDHPQQSSDLIEDKLTDGTTMLPQYDNDTDDQEIVVPFSKISATPQSYTASIASPTKPSRAKRTSSVPVRVRPPPPPLTQLGSYRSLYSNTGSDDAGYASPGIISPGGGIPSLQLQNSHSLELRSGDAVAVVEDMAVMMMTRKPESSSSTNVDAVPDSAGSPKENKESTNKQHEHKRLTATNSQGNT